MWALSAIYLTFPNSFYDVGDFLAAHGFGPRTGHRLDVLIDWMVRLHFGRSFGTPVKVLWMILAWRRCTHRDGHRSCGGTVWCASAWAAPARALSRPHTNPEVVRPAVDPAVEETVDTAGGVDSAGLAARP